MTETNPKTPEIGMTFNTMGDCRKFARDYAKQLKYSAVTDDSNQKKGYLKMDCKLHSTYRPSKRRVVSDESTTGKKNTRKEWIQYSTLYPATTSANLFLPLICFYQYTLPMSYQAYLNQMMRLLC
ncbi:unnamed protein product [Absidia cylindrospora]